MKRIRLYRFSLVILVLLCGCQNDIVSDDVPQENDGVEISLLFPEMAAVETRTIGSSIPTLNDLDLFLFVFDGKSLLRTIRIDRNNTNVTEGAVKFRTLLPQTDSNATIHIVAIDDSERKFSAQIDAVGYGTEETVMTSLYVGEQQDAYWGRVELDCEIRTSTDNQNNGTETQVQTAFSHPIPLIRNFAKVLVKSTDSRFTILGWCLVNALDAGCVVPWCTSTGSREICYPVYAEWSDVAGKNVAKTYNELFVAGYRGVSPIGASRLFPRTEDLGALTATDFTETFKTEDKYVYERRAVSVNPLYILVYGKFDGTGDQAAGNYYYKIALGHSDSEKGVFTEYNVLRNIEYTVNISSVTGVGYGTPLEAGEAPAFNNFSGDVSTRNLLSISDGVDKLYVNNTTYVITTAEQADKGFDFRTRYITDVTGSKSESNDCVIYNDVAVGAIEPGEVIATVDGPTEYTNPGDGSHWNNFHITTNHPDGELRQQTFTVYSKSGGELSDPRKTIGLSRKITLILRQPWEFVRVQTYPGYWSDDENSPDYEIGNVSTIGKEKGFPLTILFELPVGLPEGIFPLLITIESDRQDIESVGEGILVETGPSLFAGVSDNRKKYTYTVEWEQYAPDGMNSTPQSRIYRVGFVTTTDIRSLVGEGDRSETNVVVYNPYFNKLTDRFMREESDKVLNRNHVSLSLWSRNLQ